jgi:hypothetical protein
MVNVSNNIVNIRVSIIQKISNYMNYRLTQFEKKILEKYLDNYWVLG